MKPKELVLAWVDAFNRADANALAEFYEEDAVNHQVGESPVHGRAAIHQMFAREFDRSEEHTSEFQSLAYLVCRLLL